MTAVTISSTGSPATTTICIDGQPLEYVSHLSLDMSVRDVPRVVIELLPTALAVNLPDAVIAALLRETKQDSRDLAPEGIITMAMLDDVRARNHLIVRAGPSLDEGALCAQYMALPVSVRLSILRTLNLISAVESERCFYGTSGLTLAQLDAQAFQRANERGVLLDFAGNVRMAYGEQREREMTEAEDRAFAAQADGEGDPLNPLTRDYRDPRTEGVR